MSNIIFKENIAYFFRQQTRQNSCLKSKVGKEIFVCEKNHKQ